MKKLPVIIHHELLKETTSKEDEYYLDCVRQAAKYNDEVVLIGSARQKNVILPGNCKFVDADSLNQEGFAQLQKIYCDLATCFENSLIFLKRYFLMYEYMLQENFSSAIYIDSDVMLYINCAEIEAFDHCDVAMCIDKDQRFTEFNDTEGLRWVANAGFSYWTIGALKKFLDFTIDIYRNHYDILLKKASVHTKYHIPGGVSDMAILYLWIKNDPTVVLFNMAKEYDGHCFNTNIWGSRNYEKDDYRISRFTGMKIIRFHNGLPHYVNKCGEEIVGYNIHFGGVAKKMMHNYHTNSRAGIGNALYFTARNLKNSFFK